jgi:protein-tyrosine phosphatase
MEQIDFDVIKEKHSRNVKHIYGPWYLCPPIMDDQICIELCDSKITHIINTGNLNNDDFLKAHGFKFYHPRWPHTGQKQPDNLWHGLQTYIEEALQDESIRIACHCIGGQQRALSTIYFGMRAKGMEVNEIFSYIEAVTTDSVSYWEFAEQFLKDRAEGKPLSLVVRYG